MNKPVLKEGESLEDLQLSGLSIIQKKDGFRFGIDAVLLSNYVKVSKIPESLIWAPDRYIPMLLSKIGYL